MAKQRSTTPTAANELEDARKFREAVRDVTPLAQTPRPAGLAKPKRAKPGSRPPDADSDAFAAENFAAAPDAVTGEAPLSFLRAGVQPRVMRRLRRGLYPIEDELDLHGESQSAARDRLAMFLAQSRDHGLRCVSIIHGKGMRSGARGAVLKNAVNLWLRRHMDVAAFVSARAIDGGTGALYVLLRH